MLYFKKSKIDLDIASRVTITITDGVATSAGQDFVDYLRNRSNDSAWATTGSTDAANTQLDIFFGEEQDIDCLFFLQQNWKSYTCQYSLGLGALTDFSTPINVSANAEPDKFHAFNSVAADRIRIVIGGTFVADADKYCSQIIATEQLGGFSTIQPNIADVEAAKNRRTVKVLGGKKRVQRNVGAVQFTIKKNNVVDAGDLALIELLHEFRNGFLAWPNGNADVEKPDFAARLNARVFWRRRDIYLVAIATELKPAFDQGRYANGFNIEAVAVECP
jgi:hypothetical protein